MREFGRSLLFVMSLATVALVAAMAPAAAIAGDDQDPAAEIARLLADYDAAQQRGEGVNTIPIEKAILALAGSEKAPELARFVGHARFGRTAFWALVGSGGKRCGAAALEAFEKLHRDRQVACAFDLAGLRTDGARGALRKLAGEKGLSDADRGVLAKALLRAGDPAAVKRLEKRLHGRDPAELAAALLVAGDARAEEFLPRAKELAGDERRLSDPPASAFEVEERKDLGGGKVQITRTHPKLETLGAVALEAASRMVSSTTPEYVAWWYDMERGPRFGGADGRALLTAYVHADAAARKYRGHAPGASEAVRDVMDAVRRSSKDDEPQAFHLRKIRFGASSWAIEFTLGDEHHSATIHQGKVTLRR